MHVRRALALTLAVPLLLAGCSKDPEPEPKMPDPTPTSSAPSPTESETAEAESPEEFIRRWVEANTKMQNDGDVDAYRALSRKCRPCNETADRVESIYANGGYLKTKGWLIEKVVDRTGGERAPVLDLRITSSPTQFRETANAEVQSYPGGQIVMRVRLTPGEPWQVVDLTQVAS